MDIRDIWRLAAAQYPFDREHYPDIPEDPQKVTQFAMVHTFTHLVKNVGTVAGSLEQRDHGQRWPAYNSSDYP